MRSCLIEGTVARARNRASPPRARAQEARALSLRCARVEVPAPAPVLHEARRHQGLEVWRGPVSGGGGTFCRRCGSRTQRRRPQRFRGCHAPRRLQNARDVVCRRAGAGTDAGPCGRGALGRLASCRHASWRRHASQAGWWVRSFPFIMARRSARAVVCRLSGQCCAHPRAQHLVFARRGRHP